jgi:polyhydroxyalkanoate synthase
VCVHLLEWTPARRGDGGLDEYADEAIGDAIAAMSNGATKPFLMGHSLGGTLATMFAALHPDAVRGLVLLGAPLCFHPGVSRFRDAIASIPSEAMAGMDVVPGSLLSQLSAWASPETFIWSRMVDGALSMTDAQASEINARVERWTLDEVPLSGRLVSEILQWLYREDRFCRGTLPIRNRTVGPSCLKLPVLAVVNSIDKVAPPASVAPFVDAIAHQDTRVIIYPGEIGVGLQHLAVLVGRQAHAQVWPEILSWLDAHRARAGAKVETQNAPP